MQDVAQILSLAFLSGAALWVYLDARAIGDDGGRSPGLVPTRAGAWAVGVFLLLIVFLPLYLLRRGHYKRTLAARKRPVFRGLTAVSDWHDRPAA